MVRTFRKYPGKIKNIMSNPEKGERLSFWQVKFSMVNI